MKEAYRTALLVLFITETIMYVRKEDHIIYEKMILFPEPVNMRFKPIEINQLSMIVYLVVHSWALHSKHFIVR